MKITLIGPVYPYRGGIAHYNASLAQALVDAKHTVRLISFRRQYPSRLYPGESDKDPSAEPLSFPAEYILDPLYPWTWLHAACIIRRDLPDLVVFHWWTTFWAPAFTSLAWLIHRKVQVAYLIHNVIPHEAKAWDRWMARRTLTQGHAFIVQTPQEQKRLLAIIPQANVKFCTLPMFRPFSDQVITKTEARKQLGLPGGNIILLCFGIVRPYKGLKILIEAMASVPEPVHLIVAGEFWEDKTAYLRQIEELHLSKQVTILDRYIPNEEAHRLFSAADALIAPYVDGTQSAAAGVALGYKLPLIVTDIVAAGIDPVNHPRLQVVPAGDAAALTLAISSFVERLPALAEPTLSIPDDWGKLVNIIEEITHD
jgi:glycosyltransferase involved in cell wall biosynthesis